MRSVSDDMGWIGLLVSSQAWPAHAEWPEEVSSAIRAIRAAHSSLGPAGDRARKIRDEKAKSLKRLLHGCDPIYVLSHMAEHVLFRNKGTVDWVANHGVHAMVQYAQGVAFSASTPSDNLPIPDPGIIQEAFDLVAEVFLIEWFIVVFGRDESQPDYISESQLLMRLESLTDRFQGYVQFLTEILRETFGRIDSAVVSEFGWSPAELPKISEAIATMLQQRMDTFHPAAHRRLHAAGAAGRLEFEETLSSLLREKPDFLRRMFIISAQELATSLGWNVSKARAALTDLSLPPGRQPHFSLPTEDNLFRVYSVIPTSPDKYYIWQPSAIVQESHAWFYDLLQWRGLESLRTAYLRARDAVTEELTAASLARIFGAPRTHASVTYPAEGRPDVDCVVSVPGDVLVIECKAHLMTGAGRRGAPGRLGTKFDELVTKPAKQAQRFADHIRNGGLAYDSSGSELAFPLNKNSILPRLVITYERVDPLASLGAARADRTATTATWVLPLADLLVVADLLPWPSVFWYYATIRWRQAQDESLSVITEMDVLGLFLSSATDLAFLNDKTPLDAQAIVRPAGGKINNYYTAHPTIRSRIEKPTPGLPEAVVESLDQMMRDNYQHWTSVVALALSEPEKTWRRLRAVQKKASRRREQIRVSVTTQNPSLELWIERDSNGSLMVSLACDDPTLFQLANAAAHLSPHRNTMAISSISCSQCYYQTPEPGSARPCSRGSRKIARYSVAAHLHIGVTDQLDDRVCVFNLRIFARTQTTVTGSSTWVHSVRTSYSATHLPATSAGHRTARAARERRSLPPQRMPQPQQGSW
jgi:hypothetical protein